MSKQVKQQTKTKATEKANLVSNVNNVRKSMKEYYASRDIKYSKISKGHIAVASMQETFVKFFIEESTKTVGVGKAGMRSITREGINAALVKNKSHKAYFVTKADEYDEKFLFAKEVPMTPKEMDEILSGYPQISLTTEARHYMYYLLYTVYTNVLITCAKIMDYAKKTSIDWKCIVAAIDIELPKSISVMVIENINVAIDLSDKDDDEEGGEEEAAGDEQAEEQAAEEPVTQTKQKKNVEVVETKTKETKTKETKTKTKET